MVVLPTYLPAVPDRNPMFLEKRVYQGSSGRVYPLPFFNRIADRATPVEWQAVFLENEFIDVMLLPALGGRIHRFRDKTNNYDAIYHQPVIKPALVGLGGPWASGGIEFNWPQHHRPSTFMPTAVAIERHDDGAVTVWMSEHDPMARMKGMHGVCLRPGCSVLELRVRTYNRTAETQTFLWWANAATRVHEHYQSFFPPDATMVADHAKRAMETYPLASGHYYGVDYRTRARRGVPPAERPRLYPPRPDCRPNDLSWYANIPVPTSYMCLGSSGDFFGGYDHRENAGLLHVADHRIAPGKKQWTWGNHEFGYAWDRNLTEPDAHGEHAPYIELMAGVFTDNQPDFSFVGPGETRTWSQFWYPYRGIGVVHWADRNCAVHLSLDGRSARLGVAVTSALQSVTIELQHRGRPVKRFVRDLGPATPCVENVTLSRRTRASDLTLRVVTAEGAVLANYDFPRTKPRARSELARLAATEPPLPADVSSSDELWTIATHLEQYRHATRLPEPYWREALRRDAGDARAHLGLGRWHFRRGEFAVAEKHLRAAIDRLTSRNPNPADGEAFYQLGLCLRQQALSSTSPDSATSLRAAARDAFAKAAWNYAWQAPAHHALAELAAVRDDWAAVLVETERALRRDADHLQARNLRVIALRRTGAAAAADAVLAETRRLDPLDAWAAQLAGEVPPGDVQVRFDIALDCAHAGLWREALAVLADATPAPTDGTAPLLGYYRAWLHEKLGDARAARAARRQARAASPDRCFPARLEEIAILTAALAAEPRDARAAFFLGNLLYDRRRHREAIACWRRAVRHEPGNAVAWRNLGLAAFNILRDPAAAQRAYAKAVRAGPDDARLLYEQDQLAKRLGVAPERRLRRLVRARDLVAARDDLSLELCALYNQTGRVTEAQQLLRSRRFQPWEGGEGQVLGEHTRTHVLLGRAALARGEFAAARRCFEAALAAPENLGEARHLLANHSDVHYWLGEACAAEGDRAAARKEWRAAATFRGDFQEMAVRRCSELTHYSALAWQRLGQPAPARRRWRELLAFARELARTPAQVDYFATSLPTMLLFDDDLTARQRTKSLLLEAQARAGLGEWRAARQLLRTVLRREPTHGRAADLLAELAAVERR
ncbi:MAG: DUF5107 domain-containing protein [Vicinamibacterales bacterium]